MLSRALQFIRRRRASLGLNFHHIHMNIRTNSISANDVHVRGRPGLASSFLLPSSTSLLLLAISIAAGSTSGIPDEKKNGVFTNTAAACCEAKKTSSSSLSSLKKRVTLQQATHYDKHHAENNTNSTQKDGADDDDDGDSSSSSSTSVLLQRSSTRQELGKLRKLKTQLFRQWEKDEEGFRQLPARAWPDYQPDGDQIDRLEKAVKDHKCTEICTNCNGQSSPECQKLLFQLATCLVFNTIDPQRGFAIYESLAKQGHVDSMVACGVILTEGLGGVGPRELEGIEWFVFAIALGSIQATFEMATVLYTGIDGVVEEDPKAAFELFERAAAENHTAAMYMCADCLIEAEGCEQNVARAIPLLYKAADRGHRYARQRIRELLASQVYAQSMPP